VVGVDLAGYEDVTTRAHYFREEFIAVHRCGLALTCHAGENDDAEGIWRAVFDLNTRRLGHGLSLGESPELLCSVIDRGIGVEMCPYANMQIKGFAPFHKLGIDGRLAPKYPLLDYLKKGVRASINTDNIGISGASLNDNLLLAARLCPGLTRLDLLRLQRNALDSAFLDADQRNRLIGLLASNIPSA
jgi:adenosine deaminase